MFRLSFVLFYILVLSYSIKAQTKVGRAVKSQESKTALAEELKDGIIKLDEEKIQLTKKQVQIKSNLEETKQRCFKDISNLNETVQNLNMIANDNQKRLLELFEAIQNEEKEHIKLEIELKKLSEALELLEFQHMVIYEDRQLLKDRRLNNTNKICREVIESLLIEGTIQTRASFMTYDKPTRRRPHLTQIDLQIITRRTSLKNKMNEKAKLIVTLSSAQAELSSEISKCEMKKSNIQAITEETSRAVTNSDESISLLKSDLDASKSLAKAVRLEIYTCKQFIDEFNSINGNIKKSFIEYKEDFACYLKLKSYD